MGKRLLKTLGCMVVCLAMSVHAFGGNTLPASGERQSVGLVLSGGGAKGIAHLGVIQALEENEIPIDYIAGTSMGAIVGGLYASGYTPGEILELILSDDFSHWSTGIIDQNLLYYYLKPEQTPAIVKFNIDKHDSSKINGILPSSFINPLPMNIGFLELFAPQTAVCNGDFDRLFVPFRCVASDVYGKHKVVLSKGNLGDAIRMSMTFPVAFKPIELDGVPMFDGGIYDNFPVDVMKENFAPDIMIGVDVTTHKESDMTSLISQLESMIIQQEDYTLLPEEGVKLHVDLHEYGLLDFPKANEIYQKGYDKAISMIDSIKSRVKGRIPVETVRMHRDVYKSRIPEVRFDSVKVMGTNSKTEAYIKHMFQRDGKDTIGIEAVKNAYYRTVTSGKFRDLVPVLKYRPNDGLFDLALKATVKDNIGLGVGGYIASNTNNMIFLSAGYETINLHSFSSEIMGWVGQSYYGGILNARISMATKTHTMLKLQIASFQQKYYEDDVLFFEDDSPTFVTTSQSYANLVFGMGASRHSKLEISAGFGFLKDKFYPNRNVDFATTPEDEWNYRLGQAKLLFDFNTLDNAVFPVSGRHYSLRLSGIIGTYHYMEPEKKAWEIRDDVSWLEAEASVQKYVGLGRKFSVGFMADALYSTKKLYDNYTATIVQAPSFAPTQSSKGLFLPDFRSNSFVAGGIIPVFRIMDNLQFRTEFYAFSPMRVIEEDLTIGKPYYGDWFGKIEFMGEASLVYNFPFASLCLYGDYCSNPGHTWNIGISFGFYMTVPKFLR